MKKKGQVTIFIIIAIVIVVAGVLVYVFMPDIKSSISGVGEETPQIYLENCMEDTINENLELLSLQGGSINPVHSYLYKSVNIEYLCYTGNFYDMCKVEKPLLVTAVELELKNSIDSKLNECFDSMVESFEKKGYEVNLKKGDYSVKFKPEKIEILINNSLTLTKKDSVTYNSFDIIVNKNIYEVLMIAYNILAWEATYGDADVDVYMTFNPNVLIDKIRRDDGTKIYNITYTKNNEDTYFEFASRSLVIPPSYVEGESY